MTTPSTARSSMPVSPDDPFPPRDRVGTPRPSGGIPFTRLVAVELRKQLDTRAGRWLLIVIAVISAGLTALALFTGDAEGLTWTNLVSAASAGQYLLLPLIGVMAATSEWSARTALTTFTLEPRRTRVNLAKLASAIVLSVGVMLITIGIAAVLNLIGIVWLGTNGSWALEWPLVAGTGLALIVLVAQGVAFGLAFLSTPVAIVAYLALPIGWSILTQSIESIREPAEWLDLSVNTTALLNGLMTADDWPKLLVSMLVWIGIPLAIGLRRTARREP